MTDDPGPVDWLGGYGDAGRVDGRHHRRPLLERSAIQQETTTMAKTKPTTLELGSISSGTLRTDHLLEALIDALDPLRLTRSERATLNEAKRALGELSDDSDDNPYEAADDALDELTTVADAHCPDYAYYGTHYGDGADFGVWPSWDALEDDRRYVNTDGCREVVKSADDPAGYATPRYWLQVNDHGNGTLYRRAGNRWVEVWSVV